MYYTLLLLALLANFRPSSAEANSLINKEYIQDVLTKDAAWACTHQASGEYLGTGMLYYALTYIKKAKLCVCLGSGGGFVPRIMRQAQRDLCLEDSTTILVDMDRALYGTSPTAFFRTEFPEIEIIIDTTHHVAVNQGKEWQVDYLHIDADRSFQGAYQDVLDYLPLMAPKGIITFHDTHKSNPCARVIPLIREMGYDVVDFNTLGSGVAVIYLP